MWLIIWIHHFFYDKTKSRAEFMTRAWLGLLYNVIICVLTEITVDFIETTSATDNLFNRLITATSEDI